MFERNDPRLLPVAPAELNGAMIGIGLNFAGKAIRDANIEDTLVRASVAAMTGDDQIKRHGEDVRFTDSPLRVPANLLRGRPADVLDGAALARRHRAYRHRVMMGPSYRADMWAALDADPTLTATALARATHGSFATAWTVRRDFTVLAGHARRA